MRTQALLPLPGLKVLQRWCTCLLEASPERGYSECMRFTCRILLSVVLVSSCATKREQTPTAQLDQSKGALLTPSTDEPQACIGPGPQAKHGSARNVVGAPLAACPAKSVTGFYRDGYCSTGPEDKGVHVVCARVTQEFLNYSKAQGNDLVTPRSGFGGLGDGDAWCLCAARWREAAGAGVAPPVLLEATDIRALDTIDMAELRQHRANSSAP